MKDDSLPDYVRYLLLPASYPHPVGEVVLVQTHISYVFLAGDFVYKFKKPMDFGFLDFTTLEKRKYFCEQEILLNRRLCPSIYLGRVSVNRLASGALALEGPGRAEEYGVKMVRMPAERMMGVLVRNGELTRGMLDSIIRVLAPFYENAATGGAIDRFGSVAAVGRNVRENLAQCQRFVGCSALSQGEYLRINRYVDSVLARENIFSRRIRDGRVRDCHGDLHSANICLADEVYIYDCIEFNHRFRYCDVAADVAFLAMDLDFFGMENFSGYFISRFVEVSSDPELLEVLDFYKCYRAAVRGKIGLLTAHEPEVDAESRALALEQAARYFVLAQRYAEKAE